MTTPSRWALAVRGTGSRLCLVAIDAVYLVTSLNVFCVFYSRRLQKLYIFRVLKYLKGTVILLDGTQFVCVTKIMSIENLMFCPKTFSINVWNFEKLSRENLLKILPCVKCAFNQRNC